jgi:hypothetical protein
MDKKMKASRGDEMAAAIHRLEGDKDVMGVHDRLTAEFSGTTISKTAAEAHGWSDQGSDNYHFGFPAAENLFIKLISPDDGGCDGMVNIVISIQCDRNNVVKEIRCYPIRNNRSMGSYTVMEIEVFSWDLERVSEEIKSITE